jgi:hypothetical protein
MTAPLKSRTFGGTEGKKAAGEIQGPNPIKNDLDNLFASLNPNGNFTTGEPGGLQENNLHATLLALIKSIQTINNIAGNSEGNLTLQAGTGIQISAEGNTIQITAVGGQVAPGNHAITHIQGGTDPIIGTLQVDITGNAATADNAGHAVTADDANNVTTNIGGHAITDILEADGVKAKRATLADTANSAETATSCTKWGNLSITTVANKVAVSVAVGQELTINIPNDSAGTSICIFDVSAISSAVGAMIYQGYHPSLSCAFITAPFYTTPRQLHIINRASNQLSAKYSIYKIDNNA